MNFAQFGFGKGGWLGYFHDSGFPRKKSVSYCVLAGNFLVAFGVCFPTMIRVGNICAKVPCMNDPYLWFLVFLTPFYCPSSTAASHSLTLLATKPFDFMSSFYCKMGELCPHGWSNEGFMCHWEVSLRGRLRHFGEPGFCRNLITDHELLQPDDCCKSAMEVKSLLNDFCD